jgi:hypothetical protein
MKKIRLIILLTLSLTTLGQDKLSRENTKSINQFVQFIKLNQKEQLASKVSYPIERQYPLPAIKNSAEFIKRYDELFDSNIISKIANSVVKNDWSTVGWRGIMFMDGDIWLDYDGNLTSVNYQTDFEKNKLKGLIAREKQTLNSEIQSFAKPLYLIETAKFKIRIDDLGNDNLRYSAWAKNASMKTKPNLIITNGKVRFDGSGGNHSYFFSNNEYIYEIAIIVMGEEDSPPATLTVTKNGQTVLSQSATIIGK